MRAESVERLFLKNGEQPTSSHVQQLSHALTLHTLEPGVNVRRRVLPFGTVLSYDAKGGGFVSPYFAPTVTKSGESFSVTWQKGLIEGVEPTIANVPISGDRDGKVPSFEIPAHAFGDAGEALVYFRLHLGTGYGITKIEPFAAAETPRLQPYTADKLALIVYPDGSHWRALVSNQGHLAINRRAGGLAQHIFWARF